MEITTDSTQTPHAVTVSKSKGGMKLSPRGRERVPYGEPWNDDEGAEDAAAIGGGRGELELSAGPPWARPVAARPGDLDKYKKPTQSWAHGIVLDRLCALCCAIFVVCVFFIFSIHSDNIIFL
jgi:hypothetical protein